MSTPRVPKLRDYANEAPEGSVGHVEHEQARHGAAAGIPLRNLADGIHGYAYRATHDSFTGTEIDADGYTRDMILSPLLSAMREALNLNRGGWDGGTVDQWICDMARWVGIDPDSI